MVKLFSIAETVWRQIHPQPGDETSVLLAEVIASAKVEYAGVIAINAYQLRAENEFEVPSEIIGVKKIDIQDNVADLSNLKIVRGLPNDLWFISLTGEKCGYVKTTASGHLLSNPQDIQPKKFVYAVGERLIFPDGTQDKNATLVYADAGTDFNDIPIPENLGMLVRQRLEQIYLGKVGREDLTNNSSSDV